jgi:hypothetical protein
MVQRYDYDTKIVDGWKEHRGVFENDDGGYVKYEDYLAMGAQVYSLKQSGTALRELCDEIIDHLRYNKAERSEVLDDFWSKLSAISQGETPASCQLADMQTDDRVAAVLRVRYL